MRMMMMKIVPLLCPHSRFFKTSFVLFRVILPPDSQQLLVLLGELAPTGESKKRMDVPIYPKNGWVFGWNIPIKGGFMMGLWWFRMGFCRWFGCFQPKIGGKTPKYGWWKYIMEHPILKWMIFGEKNPFFGNIHLWRYHYFLETPKNPREWPYNKNKGTSQKVHCFYIDMFYSLESENWKGDNFEFA